MHCEKIKELLLTDYLDNQAGLSLQAQVKDHLKSCPACRRFEEEVRLVAVKPFKDVADPKVPDAVWSGIRQKILQRQDRQESLVEALVEKLKRLVAPRPAMAFASLILVVLVVTGAYVKYSADKDLVKEYFAQQIGFYAAVDNGEDSGTQFVF